MFRECRGIIRKRQERWKENEKSVKERKRMLSEDNISRRSKQFSQMLLKGQVERGLSMGSWI